MNEQPTRGAQTRRRILDAAQDAILAKGFAATSIEELIAAAGITKSGFFYHFRDKNDLARALIVRFLEEDDAIQDELWGRADELNEDPLHGFLVGLRLFAEMADDLPSGHPGCLVAAYAYQDTQFDAEVRRLNAEAVRSWRRRIRVRLDRIAERRPPRDEVDLDVLADMFNAAVEGGIVLSKALGEPKILSDQIMAYRSYVKLIFGD